MTKNSFSQRHKEFVTYAWITRLQKQFRPVEYNTCINVDQFSEKNIKF